MAILLRQIHPEPRHSLACRRTERLEHPPANDFIAMNNGLFIVISSPLIGAPRRHLLLLCGVPQNFVFRWGVKGVKASRLDFLS